MSEKLYSLFNVAGNVGANDLLFNQKGFIKSKTPYENLHILVIHFQERTYHFLHLGHDLFEFHIGEEFNQFLEANEVTRAEYSFEEIDIIEGEYKKANGTVVKIIPYTINTGYSYLIEDPDEEQPTLRFQTGKVGSIAVKPHRKTVKVEFIHQGPKNDPEIQKGFKDLKKSKRLDKASRFLTVIIVIVLFYLLGRVWIWIFGEPKEFILDFLPIIW